MATVGYKYVRATHARLLECIKYLQNLYQLRDWEIKLDTSFKLPREFAGDVADGYESRTSISDTELRATVWLPLVRARENDINPYEALVHEMTHLVIARCGNKSENEEEDELLVRIVSPLVYKLMCSDKRIVLGKLK